MSIMTATTGDLSYNRTTGAVTWGYRVLGAVRPGETNREAGRRLLADAQTEYRSRVAFDRAEKAQVRVELDKLYGGSFH
jgi:hypothetical protein